MLSSLTGDKTTGEEKAIKATKATKTGTGKVLIGTKDRALIGGKEVLIGDSTIVPTEGDMKARQEDIKVPTQEDIKVPTEEDTIQDKRHQENQLHSDHQVHIGTTTLKLPELQCGILTMVTCNL